jgi:murein DD-endopeptidase MepM/ murein hydrolase activator NlpD
LTGWVSEGASAYLDVKLPYVNAPLKDVSLEEISPDKFLHKKLGVIQIERKRRYAKVHFYFYHRCFDENIRIPVIHDGAVRSIFTDYLGKAVIVEHEAADDKTKRFLSIYAHTRLWAGVEIGLTLRKGDVIATIADTSSSKAGIRPHLHFSLGFPSAKLKYDAFVWNTIRKPEMVTLLDPIDIIDFSYEEAPSENPICQGRY